MRHSSRTQGIPVAPSACPETSRGLAEIRMSPSVFYRLRARGQVPLMIKLPNGELRCRRADLDAWWEV